MTVTRGQLAEALKRADELVVGAMNEDAVKKDACQARHRCYLVQKPS